MRRTALFLIALSCLGACGTAPEEPTPVESAQIGDDVNAMADAVWRYYLGVTNIPRPAMTMYQPSKTCSPQALGGGLYAYRIGRWLSHCLPDTGGQGAAVPYNFYSTYEIWENHVPDIQQPWYATLAINYLCQAAYQRAGFSYAQAYPYCSGTAASTVPAVRRWVHDTYYAAWPYWT